jgi:hypothetical protein
MAAAATPRGRWAAVIPLNSLSLLELSVQAQNAALVQSFPYKHPVVSFLIVVAAALILLVGVLLSVQAARQNTHHKKNLAALVDQAFAKAAAQRLPQTAEFRASSLTLIRAVDEFSTVEGRVAGLQSTRLYRATQETYVLFICTASSPGYLKLLTRLEAARHVRTTRKILEAEFPDLASVVRQ